MSNPLYNQNDENRPVPAINWFIDIEGERYFSILDSHVENIMPGLYVNNHGIVFNSNTGNFIHPVMLNTGYLKLKVPLKNGAIYNIAVHRLLMLVFNYQYGCEKLVVNHIDGNKLNNSFDNLEWCTMQENTQHAVRTGLIKVGEERHTSKLTEKEVREICEVLEKDRSYGLYASLAEKYNVGNATIADIATGRAWTSVSKDYNFEYSTPGVKTVLTEEDVRNICEELSTKRYLGQIADIADRYNVPPTTIDAIVQKRNWAHISDQYNILPFSKRKYTDETVHAICQILQEFGRLDNDVFAVIKSRLHIEPDYSTRQYIYKVFNRVYQTKISSQYKW